MALLEDRDLTMARTRSSEAHDKVLRAALELFGERGIDGTSVDAIAQASGVSKATIYNHWADKEALLLEVMVLVNGLDREREEVDTGDIRKDLAIVLTRRPPDEFEVARNRLMPALIAYSAVHQEFGKAWRLRVMEPPRECLRQILRRGVKQGLLRRDLDLDTSVALLLGPMLYTHIFQREKKAAPPGFGESVAETFWRAHCLARAERIEKALGASGAVSKKARRG
jgi:AcrR family transcriptional regulator